LLPFVRKRTPPPAPAIVYLVAILGLLAAGASVLAGLGRPLVCPCGTMELWHGSVRGAENSQHLADWYSPSHFIFGALFFAVMWRTSAHWPTGWLFVAGAAASVGWEVVENLPFMIERFGATGVGAPYQGDSVLNSTGDTLFALAGFGLALQLPAPATLVVVAALEVAAATSVRDSLLLSLVTFIHPTEAIQHWQAGG
jgi:hypothetical protein